MDDPEACGLREIEGTAAVAVWEARGEDPEPGEHLRRLDQRGILDAAGFLLGGTPEDLDGQ